jgi:hypothetical protein
VLVRNSVQRWGGGGTGECEVWIGVESGG